MAGELRVTRQYIDILAEGGGELRVTRQYIDILAEGGGELRVTRQYVEVLAERPMVFERTAVSEMNFTQTANLTHYASATNTLFLQQWPVYAFYPGDFEPAESTLNFVQEAVWESLLFRHPVQTIPFIQTIDLRRPYSYHNQQKLALTSLVAWHRVLGAPIEVEHELRLVSRVNRTYELDANSVMAIAQDTWRPGIAESTLSLNSVVAPGKGGEASSSMALAQTITFSSYFVRNLEHSNVVGHALTHYLDSVCVRKQYSPFIGGSTMPNSPTPPPIDIPITTVDATTTRFKLMYPSLAVPTDEIELRAPELDNIDRLASNRISRETRGGKLIVFADPDWPQVQTLIITFVGLTKTEINDLLAFFATSLGREIRLQDWEGREWLGIITTPNESAVQDGKGGCGDGSWTITFEFEGELIDSMVPGGALNLTSVAEYVVT